ncbi:DUF6082 family protein [Streptomyces sp. NPDC051132]|uniref:DUF6082 family protein n=1 Tax=Streptomyces sp. NPDC051132 TaxID=3155667 RepID=UPI00341DAF19
MKNSPAAVGLGLVGLFLGFAHLKKAERHHREMKHLEFTRLHAELLRDTGKDTELYETLVPGLDADDAARVLHANRCVTLWSSMVRLRFLPADSVAQILEDFMVVESNRKFWALARAHRAATARDAHDTEFDALANAAYDAAVQEANQTPVPAP